MGSWFISAEVHAMIDVVPGLCDWRLLTVESNELIAAVNRQHPIYKTSVFLEKLTVTQLVKK